MHNVKLIIKGPRADTSLQAQLNTYEGEFLHSLSGKERWVSGYFRENEAKRNGVRQGRRRVSVLPQESRCSACKVHLTAQN